jgi:hypothetical protein
MSLPDKHNAHKKQTFKPLTGGECPNPATSAIGIGILQFISHFIAPDIV